MTGKCTIDGDQKQSLDIALGQQQPVEGILRAGFRIGRNCNVGYFYLKKSHADCFETTGHVFQGHSWIELAQTARQIPLLSSGIHPEPFTLQAHFARAAPGEVPLLDISALSQGGRNKGSGL